MLMFGAKKYSSSKINQQCNGAIKFSLNSSILIKHRVVHFQKHLQSFVFLMKCLRSFLINYSRTMDMEVRDTLGFMGVTREMRVVSEAQNGAHTQRYKSKRCNFINVI